VLANLVDFGIGLLLVVALLVASGVGLTTNLLALPLLVVIVVLTALGVSVWLSALDVQYRDVRYAVPFLMQVWLFATPVIYAAGDVPERWRPIIAINPMTGVIEGFRWALLGGGDAPVANVAVSVGIVAALLATGLLYFRRMERTFADII
jgi:lipopolysaccharide transport system permease protein